MFVKKKQDELDESSSEDDTVENKQKKRKGDVHPRKRTKKVNDQKRKKENKETKQKQKERKQDDFTICVGNIPPRIRVTDRIPLKDTTTTLNTVDNCGSTNPESDSTFIKDDTDHDEKMEGEDEADSVSESDINAEKGFTVQVEDGDRDVNRSPKHYTGGRMEVQLEEILKEVSGFKNTANDHHEEQILKFANVHSEMLQLNAKLDTIRRTVVAVLAKELNPYLRGANTATPAPTIVSLPSTSSENLQTSPLDHPTLNTSVTTAELPVSPSVTAELPVSPSVTSPTTTVSVSTSTTSIQTSMSVSPSPPLPNIDNGMVVPVGREITIDTSGE